jgi:hypothetical protein
VTRPSILPFAIVLCMTVLAFAQTAPDPNALLDLPVEAPVYGTAPPPAPGEQGQPDEEDPRDEPPPVIYGEEIDSETDSIYYVLDISGSMYSDPQSFIDLDGSRQIGDRIDRAKCELIRSIQGLSQNFSFNVIAYDCGMLRWSEAMQEATAGNKAAATIWVISLWPGGATGTGPATALALADKENKSVVLLTDGAPNCGANDIEGHRSMIRIHNTQRATINVFGIAASGSYRMFCQNVASDSGGSYFDVP